jgi:hypothetical protein
MRRREFISLLCCATVAWPITARAQQGERARRIGVLMNRAASDPQGQGRVAAFKQRMQQLGWSEGGNVQIDVRWGEDDFDLEQKNAAQLIALAPDIIFASGTLSVAALRRLNRTVPIVFAYVADPLGAGFVDSLNRPGGNTTGFTVYEYITQDFNQCCRREKKCCLEPTCEQAVTESLWTESSGSLLAKVYRWSVPCVPQTSSKRITPRRKKRANAGGLGWQNIIPSWKEIFMVR